MVLETKNDNCNTIFTLKLLVTTPTSLQDLQALENEMAVVFVGCPWPKMK